jgi:hypothetical protein
MISAIAASNIKNFFFGIRILFRLIYFSPLQPFFPKIDNREAEL